MADRRLSSFCSEVRALGWGARAAPIGGGGRRRGRHHPELSNVEATRPESCSPFWGLFRKWVTTHGRWREERGCPEAEPVQMEADRWQLESRNPFFIVAWKGQELWNGKPGVCVPAVAPSPC